MEERSFEGARFRFDSSLGIQVDASHSSGEGGGFLTGGKMEKRIEFKMYNASPNCFSFPHIRIVWDAARASAAGESFDASTSVCPFTSSDALFSDVDANVRDW